MIALYISKDEQVRGVAYSYDELYRETFSPIEWNVLILDTVKGKTYAEKKAHVRDKAIDYSYLWDAVRTMYDIMNVEEWFYRYGKRYGLLKEFHENGIC